MSNMINFGIDLGTTNSAIAKFEKGDVQVFKNPTTLKDTLPSVIAFRKDRIAIGDKAKEFVEKDAKNTFSRFKRIMGTTETLKVPVLNQSKTPIQLSTEVLKELKTFVQTGEDIDSVVVTIPASFDTVQSNATKEAGLQAGFAEVLLLQEPIAASLAYANKKKEKELKEGQWLVYDLGGGTFDVAVLKIKDGEMKVIDHEGNNYLGGTDFDEQMVKQLLIPKLEELGSFKNLEADMVNAEGKYNGKFKVFSYNMEKGKIELSAKKSTEIEFDITDDEANEVEGSITITRSEFEKLITPYIEETIELIKKMLTRNNLTSKDIQFALMIGGSTYIPYVRKRIEEVLQIPINCDIDPITAVVAGAAYFAGSKKKNITENTSTKKVSALQIKMAYEKSSKHDTEYFAAKIEGNTKDLSYRIIREDKGYDSGIKTLKSNISEDLPLLKDTFNFFILTIYDSKNNVIQQEEININSGYGISGQPLPEDICLEVDDLNKETTKLELVFSRMSTLPLKKMITKTLNRTLIKGEKSSYRINIVEGSHMNKPMSGKSIGYMEITGKQIARDVAKGSDIELTIEMTESRDLTVAVYLTMIDQEFKQTFTAKERYVSANILNQQVVEIEEDLQQSIQEATEVEDYETAKSLKTLENHVQDLKSQTENLSDEDSTNTKYQLDDKKRKLMQEMDNVTKDKKIQLLKNKYQKIKQEVAELVADKGSDYDRKKLQDIENSEAHILKLNSPTKIEELVGELESIRMSIIFKDPKFLVGLFADLAKNEVSKMNDQRQANILIQAGIEAVNEKDWEKLKMIIGQLINLLPMQERQKFGTTGLS